MGNIQTTQQPLYFINHALKHVVEMPAKVPVKLSVWNLLSVYWSVRKTIKNHQHQILQIYKDAGATRSELEETEFTIMMDIGCAYDNDTFHIESGNGRHKNIQGYIDDGYTKVVMA